VKKSQLLIATSNAGKAREIRGILEGVPVELRWLSEFPGIPEPEETGATFADNACLKARYYSDKTRLPAAADDSGIEIDALGGAPGVQSARWHGMDYRVKFAAIYSELARQRLTTSPARFVAHVAVAQDGRIVFESAGTMGAIAPEPRGMHGLGYDPIFFYPP
jgi:XTP/dITP diphosphohydrolase